MELWIHRIDVAGAERMVSSVDTILVMQAALPHLRVPLYRLVAALNH